MTTKKFEKAFNVSVDLPYVLYPMERFTIKAKLSDKKIRSQLSFRNNTGNKVTVTVMWNYDVLEFKAMHPEAILTSRKNFPFIIAAYKFDSKAYDRRNP